MTKFKTAFIILAGLLAGGIAYAQFLQSGPYSEARPALAVGQVEVRADGGWVGQALPSGQPALFYSSKLTGTGGSQSTAHGLGVVPRICAPIVVKLPALAGILTLAATLFTAGTHTSTNCVFTALSGVDYYVMAVS